MMKPCLVVSRQLGSGAPIWWVGDFLVSGIVVLGNLGEQAKPNLVSLALTLISLVAPTQVVCLPNFSLPNPGVSLEVVAGWVGGWQVGALGVVPGGWWPCLVGAWNMGLWWWQWWQVCPGGLCLVVTDRDDFVTMISWFADERDRRDGDRPCMEMVGKLSRLGRHSIDDD